MTDDTEDSIPISEVGIGDDDVADRLNHLLDQALDLRGVRSGQVHAEILSGMAHLKLQCDPGKEVPRGLTRFAYDHSLVMIHAEVEDGELVAGYAPVEILLVALGLAPKLMSRDEVETRLRTRP